MSTTFKEEDHKCSPLSPIRCLDCKWKSAEPGDIEALHAHRMIWHPDPPQYEGQAHYMSKAAQSLIGVLTALDYSKFSTEDANLYTTNFHAMINSLMAAQDPAHLKVRRPDGKVVPVTVPGRDPLDV